MVLLLKIKIIEGAVLVIMGIMNMKRRRKYFYKIHPIEKLKRVGEGNIVLVMKMIMMPQ